MLNYIHNLRMDPACDYFREAALEGAKKMKQEENIETSALKAEFIIQYQEHGCGLLPARYLGLRNLFINMSCTKENTDARRIMGIDILFDAAIKSYGAWCEDYERRYGMDWLIGRDSMVPAADMVFIKLVRQYNVAANHNPKLDWPPKKIAEEILSFMEGFYSSIFPNECTIEEDMLDCLMYPDENIE